MLKPERMRRHIVDWLAENGHDELVAFARVKLVQISMPRRPHEGGPGYSEVSSASPGWAKRAMGHGDRENALIAGYTHAFVLTRSQFLVPILTSFRERPKQLWVEAPAARATLFHLDAHAQRGHLVRYLALDLPGGRLAPNRAKPAEFVLDSFVLESKGGKRSPFADTSDAFIAAFGERAHRIDPPAD
jgi:hypothetical protein